MLSASGGSSRKQLEKHCRDSRRSPLGCALATAPGPFAARAAWLLGFTLATPTGEICRDREIPSGGGLCERDVPRTRCAEKDEMRDRHVTIATRSRVPLGVAVGMSLSTAAWVNHTPSRAAGHPQRRCRSHALAPVVSQVDSTVESSLVALAAGFFLYVGLMEIIAKVSERGGSATRGHTSLSAMSRRHPAGTRRLPDEGRWLVRLPQAVDAPPRLLLDGDACDLGLDSQSHSSQG